MGQESWGDGDYDCSPEFFQQTERVARKSHKCYECKQEFGPGGRYMYVAGVWDGDFQTFKTCPNCLALLRALEKKYHFRYDFGMLVEEAGCAAREIRHPNPGELFHIGRLLVKARKPARDKHRQLLKEMREKNDRLRSAVKTGTTTA